MGCRKRCAPSDFYPPRFCYQKLIVHAQTFTSWKLLRYQVTTLRPRFCCVLGRFC